MPNQAEVCYRYAANEPASYKKLCTMFKRKDQQESDIEEVDFTKAGWYISSNTTLYRRNQGRPSVGKQTTGRIAGLEQTR